MADHKELSGSPSGEPFYLTVGFIRRPHGVQGEMVMDLHTDFPERMKQGRKLLVGEEHQPQTLVSVRPHQAGLLVRFRGVETPEQAGLFRNQWVYIKASEAPKLPEGRIYQYELIGFQVVDENDQPLGELAEILETGANNVYVVRDGAGHEILLPAIPSVVLETDIARRVMRVHVLEGLT
jgi:16S rRNA processing protein RimM